MYANPILADAEAIDLTISYDGSWMRRSHTSAYGIGCLIDTVTGPVLDLTVLSSYCCSCAKALDTGFRYTTIVLDGDARTLKHLSELNMYGEDVGLTKEECIYRVVKWLGTALRKLSMQTKKAGVTLGGRGRGKSTLAMSETNSI